MSKPKTTKPKTSKPKTSKPKTSKPKTSKPVTSGEKPARKSKVATPEAVRDMLAKLSPVPSFSNAQIDRYCASPGRKHSDPAKLAERLAAL